MNFLKSTLPYTIVLLFFGLQGVAKAGVDTSGGGTLVRKTSKHPLVLLELYLDQLKNPSGQAISEPTSDFKFPRTQNFKKFAVDRFEISTLPGYALAISKLSAWKTSSPILIGLLQETLFNTFYFYTSKPLPLLNQYAAPESLSPRDLVTGVLYRPEIGAVFQVSLIEALGVTSQAGLIIHEALRQIQIAYRDRMTNESLQEVTTRILLTEPKKKETLDDPGLYGGYLDALIRNSGQYLASDHTAFCVYLRDLAESIPSIPDLNLGYQSFCSEKSKLPEPEEKYHEWILEEYAWVHSRFMGWLNTETLTPSQRSGLGNLASDVHSALISDQRAFFSRSEPRFYRVSRLMNDFLKE